MNGAWNFHFLWINAVLKLHALWAGPLYSPLKWSWMQTFLSSDMNGLAQIEQLVALLYSLHCSWISHFIEILLTRCCLQMVAAAKTWSKNFLVASSPIFTWGGSKYRPSLDFTKMQLPHRTCCWYWFVKDFDDMMAHTSLVYIECFQNLRRWQKVNVVGILFL